MKELDDLAKELALIIEDVSGSHALSHDRIAEKIAIDMVLPFLERAFEMGKRL